MSKEKKKQKKCKHGWEWNDEFPLNATYLNGESSDWIAVEVHCTKCGAHANEVFVPNGYQLIETG